MPTYTPLQSIELTSNSSSIFLSNIPQNYQDLIIIVNSISQNNNGVRLRFNGSSTGYSGTYLIGATNNTAQSFRDTSFPGLNIQGYNIGVSSIAPSPAIVNIMNYSRTDNLKSILARSGYSNNSSQNEVMLTAGLFNSTAAINSIEIQAYNGDGLLYTGTTIDLYALSGVSANNPQAFGGTDIFYDSTYVYHVFKASGAFIPNRNLTADVLIVAGGGGGGCDNGGGGGAGGLRGLSSQSLTSGTSYSVIVGAGGTGAATAALGTNGNTSTFNITSASGGGGGGSLNRTAGSGGASGGSGGGQAGNQYYSGTGGSGNAGGYTPVEGNAGGTASQVFGGCGGGGASAAGSTQPVINQGGAGGAGSSAYSSWGLATGTGQLVSSTYFYAGGGGGGGNGSSAGTGGSGGGASGSAFGLTTTLPATTNTGGGGGGGGGSNAAGAGSNGGSGIVIVRYAR